jgi:hypothetical protein
MSKKKKKRATGMAYQVTHDEHLDAHRYQLYSVFDNHQDTYIRKLFEDAVNKHYELHKGLFTWDIDKELESIKPKKKSHLPEWL